MEVLREVLQGTTGLGEWRRKKAEGRWRTGGAEKGARLRPTSAFVDMTGLGAGQNKSKLVKMAGVVGRAGRILQKGTEETKGGKEAAAGRKFLSPAGGASRCNSATLAVC